MDNFMRTKASLGNSFNSSKVSFGHSKKVWREVREVLPAGGTINGVTALFNAGTEVIKAGTPVKFDESTNTIDLVAISTVEAATDPSTLGINGFLYRDIPLESADTIATGDVVVNGDIYDYAFTKKAAEVLKKIPQPNGMKIRIVH